MVASHAVSLGIPVDYYISPKVWAWKEHRVKAIGRLCRRVLSIQTGFWITGFECLDQFRGMKIAGCLAGTEHVKQVSGLGFIVDSLGFMRRG